MRRIPTLVLTSLLALCAACAGSGAKTTTTPATPEAAPAPAAKPAGALAPLAALLGDWKRADGGETHYVFAGDAIFGVSFVGDGFEVSIVTAEPNVKTRVYKDGAGEAVSDAAPASEGLTAIKSARVPALEQAEAQFAEATAARGADGWADWFDDKGGEWDPGDNGAAGKAVVGHAAIKELMKPLLSTPDFRLEWRALTSAVSPSGALGYTVGTFEAVSTAGGAHEVKRHGAYVTVWKRQADGSWKVLFDTGDPAS